MGVKKVNPKEDKSKKSVDNRQTFLYFEK